MYKSNIIEETLAKLKNPILKDELMFWAKEHDSYFDVIKTLLPLIIVVDLVSVSKKINGKILSDFASGVVLLAHSKKDNNGDWAYIEEFRNKVNPTFEIIRSYLKSEEFNNLIYGNEGVA